MDWDMVTGVSAVVGNALAVVIAVTSLRRADAALAQAQQIARETLEAQWSIEGSAAATAWRDQVLALHDRGLTPEQIRRIMLLEDGGEGLERSNGRIDDILRDVP